MNFKYLEPLLLNLWYQHKYKKFIFLLKPLGLFYKFIITIRLFLYKVKFFKSYHPGVPVIVVGNITVGGTGKTPFVIALVNLLQSQGYRPCVILRGYNAKQKNANRLIIVNNSIPVELCGDEAKLIYNNLQCPVVVSTDRLKAAQYFARNQLCNIIVSDDGLQHYRLQRDIEICVVDSVRRFGNGQLLPIGPLREGLKRLKKVDYLLIKTNSLSKSTSADGVSKKINEIKEFKEFQELKEIKDLKSCPQIYSFDFCASDLFNISSNNFVNFGDLTSTYNKIYVVSGIGNNQSFIESINALNIISHNINIISYPDHYHYKINDFDIIKDPNHAIVTTEKDAVKILELMAKQPNFQNIYYLKACVQLPEDFAKSFLSMSQELVVKYNVDHNINQSINQKSLEENIVC